MVKGIPGNTWQVESDHTVLHARDLHLALALKKNPKKKNPEKTRPQITQTSSVLQPIAHARCLDWQGRNDEVDLPREGCLSRDFLGWFYWQIWCHSYPAPGKKHPFPPPTSTFPTCPAEDWCSCTPYSWANTISKVTFRCQDCSRQILMCSKGDQTYRACCVP